MDRQLYGTLTQATFKVGGSIAGLMCGIGLMQAGHNVQVVEQDSHQRQSYVSGLGLGTSGEVFLRRHDRLADDDFSQEISGIRVLKNDGSTQLFATGRRRITSWDALYFRLRSNFDQFPSSYYPTAPLRRESDGQTIYRARTKVVGITCTGTCDGGVVVDVLNRDTEEASKIVADVVVGADGPDSMVRAKYLPTIRRRYVGYIAWRGIVPERDLSYPTRQMLAYGVIVYTTASQHCIMYTIPGTNGSFASADRMLNFTWYTNQPLEALDEFMIDGVDGHRHHNTVPPGRVKENVWSAQVDSARSQAFPATIFEIISKIRQPFIQVITDFCSPRAVFENGKVVVIGDALALFRPHTGYGASQAAFHALTVVDYINGKIRSTEWEDTVLQYSGLHWSESVWWGNFYQAAFSSALLAGLRYWARLVLGRARLVFSRKVVNQDYLGT
ncbi:FAD/NAD(P)-binding domain-containing protein [Hypoxylon sp. FL1284]|nr:FAD/NAD(P)-binding domain-containing protein [Hypoxylon sp. FL1284]